MFLFSVAAVQQQEIKKPVSQKRPNILFCIADDASFRSMSAYGLSNKWIKTPGFDKVAAEGILFTHAFTPNAKCSPSRSSILTGNNPWQLEAAGNHSPYFPEKFATWVEILGKNGYKTGYAGKGWAPGNAGKKDGEPRLLTGKNYSRIKMQAPTKAISPINYAANFEEFLNERAAGESFCFWYGGHEPHRAYEYGSGAAVGKKKITDIDRVPAYWPDDEVVRNDMLDYAYELEYFDMHLQKMLQVLDAKGELDNTIVIVTSDNGMPFPRTKGHVYDYANHLPLAIMWPGGLISPGRKVSDLVSFIDFAPTILEAAGLSLDVMRVQGRSLMPLIKSPKTGWVDPKRTFVLLGKERTDVGRPGDQGYPVRGIIKDDLILTVNYEPNRWPAGNPETGYLDTDGSPTKTDILNKNRSGENSKFWNLSFGKKGAEELYDLKTDPDAIRNLADHPTYLTRKNAMRKLMERELRNQNDPRMFGNGSVFDRYPFSDVQTRNFYERFMKGEKINASWVNETDFEKVN